MVPAPLVRERVGAYTLLPNVSIQRPSRLIAVLLVLAGLAGVLIEQTQVGGLRRTVPAQGGFWKILSRDGLVKQVAPPSEGIVLLPGDSFRLDGVYSSVARLRSMTLRVQDTGTQSGNMLVQFRNQGVEMYRLRVVPGESVQGTLSYMSGGKPPELLANVSKPGLLSDPDAPFDLTLRTEGSRFVVEINGEELLRATDDRIANGHLVVWGDYARLLRVNLSGTTMHADGSMKRFRESEYFLAYKRLRSSGSTPLAQTLVWILVVLLASAGYLRNLCLGAPPLRLLWRGTFSALAPAGALLALRPFVSVPHEPLLILLAGSFGLLFALFVLREHVRAIVPTGARGIVRALIVVVALGGSSAWVHGHARELGLAPVIKTAERSMATLSDERFLLETPLRLDPSNAITMPGPYRSLVLDAELTLEPDSLLEVRLHAEAGLPNGVALFLSSDARWQSGFILESKGAFRPASETFGVLEPGRGYDLSVRVRGEAYEVWLDGRRVCSADIRAFASGSVVVLAARGEVQLESLVLGPITPEPPVRDASNEARAASMVPWMTLGLLTLAAVVLLIIPFLRALEGAAWMLVPIALGLHGWAEPSGRLTLTPYLWVLVAFFGFALPWTLLHRQRSGPLRTTAFLVLVAVLGFVALDKGSGPPVINAKRAGNLWDQFDLPRIDPGLSYLQHPYIRRFNSYVLDHTFRGRTFSADPAPGVTRIISVGTSSTWGHGIEVSTGADYPTVLEGLLSERLPGRGIEVINGAVRGSTAARLLRVFRESLLVFQPDIVTVSLYFNDSSYATSIDEESYLTRISQPDYEHSVLERVREMWHRQRNTRITNHVWKSMQVKHGDSLGSWKEVVTDPEVRSPPEHFEACLRAFAELGREHGFQLVLIKEPISGDMQRIWRDEFRAVMDRLGEEYGLPVVDPAEALAAAGGRKLFMDDVHPLPEGHRVMAEVLGPVLERVIRKQIADQ